MNLDDSPNPRQLCNGNDTDSTRPWSPDTDALPSQAQQRSLTGDSTSDRVSPQRQSSCAAAADAIDNRKDSLLDPGSQPAQNPTHAASAQTAADPAKSKPAKHRARNESRHIYLCAYHDDLLTPSDRQERRRRGHLAFKWDLFVKREAADASGTRFHLTTSHVQPGGRTTAAATTTTTTGGAGEPWRRRSQARSTEQRQSQSSADGVHTGSDWEFQVSRWAHTGPGMVMCLRIGTARYRHAGALGEGDRGEDDEDEMEEVCERTEVGAGMTTWEWAAAVVERLWQDGIIWRHVVYAGDHDMFAPLGARVQSAYDRWRASADQVRRRRPVHGVYPGLDRLSCDEEALQDAACGVCRLPRYGFHTEADVRWLFPGRRE